MSRGSGPTRATLRQSESDGEPYRAMAAVRRVTTSGDSDGCCAVLRREVRYDLRQGGTSSPRLEETIDAASSTVRATHAGDDADRRHRALTLDDGGRRRR